MKIPLFALQSDDSNAHVQESYFLIQYFDFVLSGQKEFTIPNPLTGPYTNLFSLLHTHAKRKRSLENQSIYLFMKEAYQTCTIVLHTVDTLKKKTTVLFRHEFPKEEWRHIEDLFLKAGLAVCKRKEKRAVRYEFQSPPAECELLSGDRVSSFTITAPDERAIFECISKFGKSIDEECVTI